MKSFFPRMNSDAGATGGGGAAAVAAAGGAAGGAAVAAVDASAGGAAGGGGAQPSPYYADLIGKDGTLNQGSFARLPENLKGLTPTLASMKTVDDMFAKLSNLNALAGRKGLAPLAANATAEDIAAQQTVLRAVLGVPEKPEGYGFTRPADLPEANWDPKLATAVQELLHKHNGSPALAKDLFAMQTQLVKDSLAGDAQYAKDWYAKQDTAFREALTKDGLDYDKTNALIDRVALQYGIPQDAAILKNAQVRLLLNQVGKSIGEAKFVAGDSGAAGGTQSDQALAEDIMHNKANPEYAMYWAGVNGNPDHAKSGEIRTKVQTLLANAARLAQAAKGAAAGTR